MMARSHVIVGVAAWLVAAPLLHLPLLDPAYFGLTVAGALLPDVDQPKSWIGQRSRPLSTALGAALGHRGLTHSAVAVLALVGLLQAGYHRAAVSALAVGYASHIAADLLTPQGLRLTWPLRLNWRVPIYRTGSRREAVVVTIIMCGVGWWLLSGQPPAQRIRQTGRPVVVPVAGSPSVNPSRS